MNPEQQKIIAAILDDLEQLVPGGREYVLAVAKQLAEMVRERDWAEILQVVQDAANLPAWLFRTKRWTRLASIWMLVKLMVLVKAQSGWPGINDHSVQALRVEIQGVYDDPLGGEDELEEGVVEALFLRGAIRYAEGLIDRTMTDLSQQAWAPRHFTDPTRHTPFNFCYLIHAMRPQTLIPQGSSEGFEEIRRTMGDFVSPSTEIRGMLSLRAAEMFLTRPELLCGEILSCSVISHQHVLTYGGTAFGFVLFAPVGTVLTASSRDLSASSVQNQARPSALAGLGLAQRMHAQHRLVSGLAGLISLTFHIDPPQTILSRSSGHNEVVVLGRNGSLRVHPRAIFIKVTRNGELWQTFANDARTFGLHIHIAGCAKRLGIPIIPIIDDSQSGSGVMFEEWVRLAMVGVSPSLALSLLPPPTGLSSLGGPVALRMGSSGTLALRDPDGFLIPAAPQGTRTYTVQMRLGDGAVRLDFNLPENHTLDDIFRVFFPVFQEYLQRRRQRTSVSTITGPMQGASSNQIVETTQEPEDEQEELMRRILTLVQQLVQTARPGEQLGVPDRSLTWYQD